jgi:hypothetical protein
VSACFINYFIFEWERVLSLEEVEAGIMKNEMHVQLGCYRKGGNQRQKNSVHCLKVHTHQVAIFPWKCSVAI